MQTHNAEILRPKPKAAGSPGSQGSPRSRMMREIVETILLTALVYFVVRSSVQFTPIQGPSMQPGLHDGQAVIVNELGYVFGSPQRGDVIVFHPPSDPRQQYIKRIIAVPGDTVAVTDTAVIVDGVTLKEPYVNGSETGGAENGAAIPDQKLGPGEYFVMGDNRGDSIDSRIFGSVPRQNIVGKAEFVTWPVGAVHWIDAHREVFAGVHR